MTQTIVKNRYTSASIPDKIKKELATVKFDVEEYKIKIDKYKKNRPLNECYYNYDHGIRFLMKKIPKISFDIDDRWYYYKAYHYLKLGLFLRKDAPPFKVSLSHLSPEMIYELSQLDENDRKFVL